MQWRPRPETLDESSDCKVTLTADELKMITGGPKSVDLGTVSVYTTVPRNFTILNELRNHVLVAIDLGDEPEIAQPPPQVIACVLTLVAC